MPKNELELIISAATGSASRAISGFGNTTSSTFKKMTIAASATGAAMAALGVASVLAAAKLEKGIAEVGTLIGKNAREMESFSVGVTDIMARTGEETETLTKGLFDLVSAGVDVGESIEVLGIAADLATAGVTDVSVAVDGMTSILNAYGLAADQATDVSDLFFQGQKFGKTTVAELSGAIGRLAPIMAASSVSAEEMFAAVSTVTLAGISTDEAVTSLTATMKALLDPQDQAAKAAEKMGLELGAAAFESKGFTQVIKEITEATGGNIEKIQELGFTQRALKGILTLTTGEGKKYNEILEGMGKRSGSTQKAAEQMRDTFSGQFQILKGKLNAQLIELGNTILPSVTAALKTMNFFLDSGRVSLGLFFSLLDNRAPLQKAKAAVELLENRFRELAIETSTFPGASPEYIDRLRQVGTALNEARVNVIRLTESMQETPVAKTPGVGDVAPVETGRTKSVILKLEEEWTKFFDGLTFKNADTFEKIAIVYEKNLEKFGEMTGAQAILEEEFLRDTLEKTDEIQKEKFEKEKEKMQELEDIQREFAVRKLELLGEDLEAELELIDLKAEQELEKLTELGENEAIIKDAMAIVDLERDKKKNAILLKEQLKIEKEFTKLEKQRIEDAERIAAEEIRIKKQAATDITDITQALFVLTGSKSKALFRIVQAAAIGKAVMFTYLSATKAYAEVPFPFNIAASASIVALGLANVAKISAQKMAHGGVVTSSTLIEAGEAGPEAIIPLDKAEDELSGLQGNLTINFNGPILGDPEEAREFAIALDRELLDLKNQGQSLAFA